MDHSKEGIYDNPLMKRAPREVIKQKPKDKMEEAIYGEREDVSGGDELYEDPKLAGAKNIQYTETGIYDNPENVKPPDTTGDYEEIPEEDDPLYDNPKGAEVVAPEDRLKRPRRKPEFDNSIYGKRLGARSPPKGPKQKWPLIHQPWFHGPMERTEASALLEKDGDFFVRESTTKKGQFVLTAMANKQAQNLLLIDSTGKVKAKDKEFANVPDLVYYFLEKATPINMEKVKIFLKTPVENSFPKDDIYEENAIYQATR